jgi:hypothetical protein
MNFLPKPKFAMLFVVAAASSALFAQNGGQAKHPDPSNVPDGRQIASQSLAATERSWRERGHFTYMKRDDDRRFDSQGQVKTENIDVTRMMVVNGARFEQLTEHNGQAPTVAERRKSDEDLDNLKHETPAQHDARLNQDQENMSILHDVLEAFDFQLVGEDSVDGRPAYVVQLTPHPGYRPHGKYGKIFNKIKAELWIDKQDFGTIKVEGDATQPISIGVFVVRMESGSHITLEQTRVGDAVWVPKRIELRASARILFLKSLDMDKILTYSDYHRVVGGTYSVSR